MDTLLVLRRPLAPGGSKDQFIKPAQTTLNLSPKPSPRSISVSQTSDDTPEHDISFVKLYKDACAQSRHTADAATDTSARALSAGAGSVLKSYLTRKKTNCCFGKPRVTTEVVLEIGYDGKTGK